MLRIDVEPTSWPFLCEGHTIAQTKSATPPPSANFFPWQFASVPGLAAIIQLHFITPCRLLVASCSSLQPLLELFLHVHAAGQPRCWSGLWRWRLRLSCGSLCPSSCLGFVVCRRRRRRRRRSTPCWRRWPGRRPCGGGRGWRGWRRHCRLLGHWRRRRRRRRRRVNYCWKCLGGRRRIGLGRGRRWGWRGCGRSGLAA